ncbi:MAG: ABC transporter substrate-binding protein, partial [Pirellulales bacterium]
YREAGLDVEIVKGGPGAPIIPQVAGGQMEFGISNADGLLLGRGQDAPVVAVMAPLQVSPRCIMVHERSGIDDFSELRDMTIAMSNSQPFYHFLRKQVPLEGVTIVPYQGSVAQFLLDENFAQQAYVFSEPFVARQQGGDPKSLMLADLGFNPYTSVLFTSEATIHKEAELVGTMVQASVRGWEQYLASPEKTNRTIHQVNREMSLEALAYGAATLEPLVRGSVAGKQGIGGMSLARWRELAGQLEEIELLEPGAVRVEQAFTTEFLK